MNFPQVWDLNRFFDGGSSSTAFQSTYQEIEIKLISLENNLKKNALSDAIDLAQEISLFIREMEAFVSCLIAQNVHDTKARTLETKMHTLFASFTNKMLLLDDRLIELSNKEFETLITQYQDSAFILKERRKLAKEKLSYKEESLINDLSINGYHGWSQLWSTFIGDMTFPFQGEKIFFGQIENKMADPNRSIRKEAFESITNQFTKYQSLFAQIINHIGGFRLKVYENRGWTNFLQEPIIENRMEISTLNTMWDVIKKNHTPFIEYIKCKAALLKTEKLSWYDLEAPLGSAEKTINYDEASNFVIQQFNQFSPKMGNFAKRILENHWIEAEDRKGKSPGGFCTALPINKESRIFMTFSNTMSNLFTLAHEIGHAFHNEIIFPLPEMLQHPKMNVAETASTMAEMIVTKGAIKKENDPRQRLLLLDDHLSRSVAYLMNIYSRFLFETAFYEERKKGFVPHTTLCKLMLEAQKTAFGDSLETYHPFFWAAKMHFYFTDVPFYNFPYTFGYLFSLGIFSHAHSEDSFEDQYIALLKDTGRMNVEDLAQKHLGVDLRKPDFWDHGLQILKNDIQTFLTLYREL